MAYCQPCWCNPPLESSLHGCCWAFETKWWSQTMNNEKTLLDVSKSMGLSTKALLYDKFWDQILALLSEAAEEERPSDIVDQIWQLISKGTSILFEQPIDRWTLLQRSWPIPTWAKSSKSPTWCRQRLSYHELWSQSYIRGIWFPFRHGGSPKLSSSISRLHFPWHKAAMGDSPTMESPLSSLITRDQDYEKQHTYELLMITVIYISLIVVKKRWLLYL